MSFINVSDFTKNTEATKIPNVMPNSLPWPRISIITPSYNQGQFIEETIRSVLFQEYPNLEYMIIDGGSTDNSIDIIRKYEHLITYWVSEPDQGQAQAINKGFKRCTGDLVGWINSDDLLLPGALMKLAEAYTRNPDVIILGDVINFVEGSRKTRLVRQKNVSFETIATMQIARVIWHQPGTFVPVKLVQTDNICLDEALRYSFDQDWMCRLLKKAQVMYLSEPVAMFRLHSASKTVSENIYWLPEVETVIRRYWDEIPGLDKNKVLAYFETFRAAILLGAKKWDRKKGIRHLLNALSLNPSLLCSSSFLGLFLRSILPRFFLIWVRSRMNNYR